MVLDEPLPCRVDRCACYGTEHVVLGEHHRLFLAGLRHYLKQRYDKAAACFREVIEADARFASAHNNLGVLAALEGNFSAARTCFDRAAALDPAQAVYQCNRALVQGVPGIVQPEMSTDLSYG